MGPGERDACLMDPSGEGRFVSWGHAERVRHLMVQSQWASFMRPEWRCDIVTWNQGETGHVSHEAEGSLSEDFVPWGQRGRVPRHFPGSEGIGKGKG